MPAILNERELDFLLYELLDTEKVLSRPRYTEHSREVFDATLATARTVAEKYFANHYAKGDQCEPTFDGKKVSIIPETKEAWDNFSEAGFLVAHYDYDQGGMQLPETVLRAAMGYFFAANIATAAYQLLTLGAANLINTFASDEQKALYLPLLQNGSCAGTMAMTEPNQGSALGDIRTIAKPADDGSYRIFGNKMFISGGDQCLTENILHLVLAKIEGAPAGVKGISLFLCPKFLVNADGSPGERNDVALAGLLHKMGYRNTTSTVLNFGEKDGAVGYLVGEPHKGLSYMFQMMNEARIGVGLGAASLGYQGYLASLDYARERRQGRLPSSKDPLSAQVTLIEHADIRRMLLAQKAYSEASLAMCLYASSLLEDSHTGETAEQREKAFRLLDLITPIVKSWPSRYGIVANDHAIQILGGAGYTREHPIEQYLRDNRLNPIHEGAEGIHGLDILGRKVVVNGGADFELLMSEMDETINAATSMDRCAALAAPLKSACAALSETTVTLRGELSKNSDKTLSNATIYLDAFGRVFAAWIWLKQAVVSEQALSSGAKSIDDEHYYRGKLQAAQYYVQWELPQLQAQLDLLNRFDNTTLAMHPDWF
ncbi:acyl-CoA dehydrogenase [Halioxenophilus sp. WMMB6]|uniref:acyl-CoA dehydrogenase n=1 Tax=Halioxenophilus sp. WMMB6 TaxID=3073815 RepID=UPI00295E2126|nr:acyl-CoA dehydrogenase [Halioxenophilus sp. WMMB6]